MCELACVQLAQNRATTNLPTSEQAAAGLVSAELAGKVALMALPTAAVPASRPNAARSALLPMMVLAGGTLAAICTGRPSQSGQFLSLSLQCDHSRRAVCSPANLSTGMRSLKRTHWSIFWLNTAIPTKSLKRGDFFMSSFLVV